jgi:hypothetical protein
MEDGGKVNEEKGRTNKPGCLTVHRPARCGVTPPLPYSSSWGKKGGVWDEEQCVGLEGGGVGQEGQCVG